MTKLMDNDEIDHLQECKESLIDLVYLWAEYEDLNGGGPGWQTRFKKALSAAQDLVRIEP